MSDLTPMNYRTEDEQRLPELDSRSDIGQTDNKSHSSLSDSDLSDLPSTRSSRPLSLVNPTSIQLLSSNLNFSVLSDYQKIATSLTISSSSSSNFEISDYEGDCSSDETTASLGGDDDVFDDVITTLKQQIPHFPNEQEAVGAGADDRSTTSSQGGERHEVALHPLTETRSSSHRYQPSQQCDLTCCQHPNLPTTQRAQDVSQGSQESLPPCSSGKRVPHYSGTLQHDSLETLIPSSISANSVFRFGNLILSCPS